MTRIMKAMKEGTYKTLQELEDERTSAKAKGVFLVWNDELDDILAESRRWVGWSVGLLLNLPLT